MELCPERAWLISSHVRLLSCWSSVCEIWYVEILELATDEPDIAHAALSDAYSPGEPMRFSGDPTDFSCRLWFASAGDIGAGRLRHTMGVRATMSPVEFFLTNVVLGGSLNELAVNGMQHRARAGQSVLVSHPGDLLAVWDDIDVATLRLPSASIDRVAREPTGTRAPVRFAGMAPCRIGPAIVGRG